MGRHNAGTKGVPRADREHQILVIAAEEFGTQGYAATSVSTIAERAGISKPLIYSYFGSKDGLYVACLDYVGTTVGDEVEFIARGDAVGIERGLLTLTRIFEVLESRPYLWRLPFDPSAPTTGPVAETTARHLERLHRLAHEGVAELLGLASIDDELDVSAMTSVWLGIVDSVMNWWMNHPDQTAIQMHERALRLINALFLDAARRPS